MPVTYELMKAVTADLYDRSLRKIPDDTKGALEALAARESDPVGRKTLWLMRESAREAEAANHYVCSDNGVPVYSIKIGTRVRFEGDIRRAIADGFAALVARIQPPLLKHVTNPLTNERDYHGKDMPICTFDLVDGADYVEIACQPKALGSGRWADLEIFSFPTLERIEQYVLECVVKAGGQTCPPVVVGVGIGGTFDYCARIAKEATYRKIGSVNPEPVLAAMEARLVEAVNKTGFGPMGTGGDATALAVHVDYASGHGFTPVAVSFNCWINRRTRARIYDDGRVEGIE
mgnify:CR=1 FL=1